MLKTIAQQLYLRIIVSKWPTLAGLAAAGAIGVFNEKLLPYLNASPQPWLHLVAGLIATYGVAFLDKAAVAAYFAKKQAELDAKQAPPASGFIRLGTLAVLAALALLAIVTPRLVKADDPKFGGCAGQVCFGPAVSVNVLSMAVRDGALTSTFDPGIGYGATVWASRWYRTGFSTTFAFPQYDSGRRLMPSGIFSFAEYVRLGLGCPLYVEGGFQRNAQILLGFGADFGKW